MMGHHEALGTGHQPLVEQDVASGGPARRDRTRRGVRGFTLLEVLVAIALIGLLLGAIMTFLVQVQADRAALLKLVQRSRQLTSLIDRIEADLLAVVAGDQVLGAGFKGNETSLALLSLSPTASEIESGTVRGGLVATRLDFDAAAGSLTLTRADGLRGGAGEPRESVTGLARVRWRYYVAAGATGGLAHWTDSFDSLSEGGLPLAVELAVWFGARPLSADQSDGDGPAGTVGDAAAGGQAERIHAPDRVRVIAIAALGGGADEEKTP